MTWQIFNKDERNMIITTNCWLNQVIIDYSKEFFSEIWTIFNWIIALFQNWLDFKLTWNPKEYDGIELIHIPAERIWKPDIILCKYLINMFSKGFLKSIFESKIFWSPENVNILVKLSKKRFVLLNPFYI